MAEAPAQTPMARPRAAFGKEAATMARLCGASSAAPTPCSARAAIRVARSGAAAQASEASANTAIPIEKTRRRPIRSPSPPPIRISAPSISA